MDLQNRFKSAIGAVAMAAIAGTLVCGASAPAAAAAAHQGWQGVGSLTFQQGETSHQVGYACPSAYPVAQSGAYAFNAVGQITPVYVTFNGPRIDENPPDLGSWGWHFYFPSGAPANVTVLLDVYCVKK